MFQEQIRQATRESHLRLEKVVIHHLKNIRSYKDYGNLLYKFYRYFEALEQAIAPYITENILPGIARRRKAGRLLQDLESIDHPLPETTEAVMLPLIDDHLKALGALYVMEGSVMGGSIIVKMLEEKSNIHKGLSFFQGYGEETALMWQQFRDSMEKQVGNSTAAAVAIDAANSTFENFLILFGQHDQKA